jgi:hypothetical protein
MYNPVSVETPLASPTELENGRTYHRDLAHPESLATEMYSIQTT